MSISPHVVHSWDIHQRAGSRVYHDCNFVCFFGYHRKIWKSLNQIKPDFTLSHVDCISKIWFAFLWFGIRKNTRRHRFEIFVLDLVSGVARLVWGSFLIFQPLQQKNRKKYIFTRLNGKLLCLIRTHEILKKLFIQKFWFLDFTTVWKYWKCLDGTRRGEKKKKNKSILSNIKVASANMSGDVPSASRGDQCPEGSQGRGEEELEAYWSRTLPSVHLSHTDPTSLGNQHTGRANNLETGQTSVTWVEQHFKVPPWCRRFVSVQSLKQLQLISPVVKVARDGMKPFQGDGIMMLFHHLRRHWYGGGFGLRLPGLVDEVQVTVHPRHLVQGEGVRAGVVCRRQRWLRLNLDMNGKVWIFGL